MTTPTLVIAQQYSSAIITALSFPRGKNSARFSKQPVI
jgi:hypothetical protein